MDVALYARISSDRTGLEAGVRRQLEDTRDLAGRHGDHVVTELVDNDTSAYSRKPRQKYLRLVDQIKAGEVRGVYVWHPDRLYRRLRDLEDLVDLVDAHDLVIRTVKAGDIDLSTSSGRMTARVIGSVAQHESEQKAERQARKHRELAEQGRASGGGRRPLGYLADRVTLDPLEAEGLQRAADRIIAGMTLAEATRRMSAELGRTIRATGLKGALTGYRIVGLREHVPVADRRRGAKQGVVTEAVWPAILDETTWRKVRAILTDPRRVKKRPPRSYLLSGLLRCGWCGQPMAGGQDGYKCQPGRGGCGRIGVARGPVDRIVEEFARREADTDAVRRRLAMPRERPPLGAVDDLQARLATLAEMLADGAMTPDEWRVIRDRVMHRIEELRVRDADDVVDEARARQLVSVLGDWEHAETSEKRVAISVVLDAADVVVKVEPRGKKAGPTMDPERIKIVSRAEVEAIADAYRATLLPNR
jgi:DNA invertase Pin-like site-specific DNA recombinase